MQNKIRFFYRNETNTGSVNHVIREVIGVFCRVTNTSYKVTGNSSFSRGVCEPIIVCKIHRG